MALISLPAPDISILICTRNRCADLRRTLASLGSLTLPIDHQVEVVVVDNGSTDDTAAVIQQSTFNGCQVRYIFEPCRGRSNALNTGIRECKGKVILITDDDVRLPGNWIDAMSRPILNGEADALAGGIRMADHLQRSWMKQDILVWRDVSKDPPPGVTPPLIGACCSYSRRVFERVPRFDGELGTGGLGCGEDILFSDQLKEAGFRIGSVITKTQITHHFDPARLTRASLIQRSMYQGRSDAYISYHWLHERPHLIHLRLGYHLLRLLVMRLSHIWRPPALEGITPEESEVIGRIEFFRGHLNERRRPRQYTKRGLTKLGTNGRLEQASTKPATID